LELFRAHSSVVTTTAFTLIAVPTPGRRGLFCQRYRQIHHAACGRMLPRGIPTAGNQMVAARINQPDMPNAEARPFGGADCMSHRWDGRDPAGCRRYPVPSPIRIHGIRCPVSAPYTPFYPAKSACAPSSEAAGDQAGAIRSPLRGLSMVVRPGLVPRLGLGRAPSWNPADGRRGIRGIAS
jgi:hypothetical protein